MKMQLFFCWSLLGLVILGLSCGCSRGPSLAEIESRERSSRLYKNAVDDLQAGRMHAALQGFQRVIREEPKNDSAHFQLAVLLQDVQTNYIEAIAHYRTYLALRPTADKARVAQDRMKRCETDLTDQIILRAGGSAANKLAHERDQIARERDSLKNTALKLQARLTHANQEVKRLSEANARKMKWINALSSDNPKLLSKLPALKKEVSRFRAEEAQAKPLINPSDSELLDTKEPTHAQLASELDSLVSDAESDLNTSPVRVNGQEINQLRQELADLDHEPLPEEVVRKRSGQTDAQKVVPLTGLTRKTNAPALPTPPETYRVQPGDTLFGIARKFYGTARRADDIQKENRALIPPTGRLKVGQLLKLPRE